MNMQEILSQAVEMNASDVYLVGGLPLTFKINGRHTRIEPQQKMMPDEISACIAELYSMIGREQRTALRIEDDFSFGLARLARFRANVFLQRGSLSAVIRVIRFGVPDPVKLHIPEEVLRLADLPNGLILFSGAAGSGKSTSLACLIDRINCNREKTIITMEDPIEIIHNHKNSVVIQREIALDTESFMSALRASLRQAPDVLLLGEMRDGETMEVAMTAAETGQLLLSSMHTLSAADTADRIVDSFPENKQRQIRMQLARVLRAVVCQKLVPAVSGGLVPVFELMSVTPAVQNLIREGKSYQFNSLIREGGANGMRSFNQSLLQLLREGTISRDTAMDFCDDTNWMERRLKE